MAQMNNELEGNVKLLNPNIGIATVGYGSSGNKQDTTINITSIDPANLNTLNEPITVTLVMF